MRIFANPNYNFLRWRWHALIASVLVIWLGGLTIYLHHGLRGGIEFTGGTQLLLNFDAATDEQQVRKALDPISNQTVVQKVETPNKHQMMIRLPLIDASGDTAAAIDADAKKVTDALTAAHLGYIAPPESTAVMRPSVSSELTSKGIWATVASLGGILIYVMFRFRLTFAIGAVVAAFHDILITVAMLSWFHYDMTLNVIAALLTITGYSVNDTIVVFDRVRENQRLMRREPLDQIINTSVNQTLGRTIITSGATLLAVASLYALGGEVLRGFAFTMIVGVITGTYSTVFIAASIAMILTKRPPANPGATAKVPARAAAATKN